MMKLNEVRLGLGDLYELSGVTRAEASKLATNGAVCPRCGGGPGRHKQYGFLDALAIAYGFAWGDYLESPAVVLNVAKAVQEVGLDGIRAAISRGECVLLPPMLMAPLGADRPLFMEGPVRTEGGDIIPFPNLAAVYVTTQEKVLALAQKAERVVNERGRRTVLVANSLREK